MPPIAEVGSYLGTAVALMTIVAKVADWLAVQRDESREKWFRNWTRPGEPGEEHFGELIDRFFQKGERR